MTAAPRTLLTSLVLLGLGAAGAYYLLATAPQTEPTEREKAAKLVQTITLTPRDEEVTVSGSGTVIPARRVTIQPEVSGRITAHHESFIPGGLIRAGEELLSIDRSDYENALAEQLAAREEALFELAVEEGRQAVAAREWEELKNELPADQINEALVLRKPHLERAKAMLTKADNAVARAELDLSRTTITAPFNAIVLDEAVEVGQLVAEGDQVATLAGTDSFWVRVTLPVADLQHIRLPATGHAGASARVGLDTDEGDQILWDGQVTQLLGDLESTGLMARILVTIPDPLRIDGESTGPPLLLGSFVEVEIEAGRLENILEIPRAALREGDRIWLVGEDNTLRIRDTRILWRRKSSVLVANVLEPGEQLIVSDLNAALPGMDLAPQPLQEADQAEDAEEPPAEVREDEPEQP